MYCTCTIHVLYMYNTCTVHVLYMYCTCIVHVLYGAIISSEECEEKQHGDDKENEQRDGGQMLSIEDKERDKVKLNERNENIVIKEDEEIANCVNE